MIQNLNVEVEKADLAEGRLTTKIEVPVLAIDAQPDKASIPHFFEGSLKPHVTAELIFKIVQSQGHYPHIVSKDEVNQYISELISKVES